MRTSRKTHFRSINNFSDYGISQSVDCECPSLFPHVLSTLFISMYKLGDAGISSNLIGSQSLTNEQLFTEVEVNILGFSPRPR